MCAVEHELVGCLPCKLGETSDLITELIRALAACLIKVLIRPRLANTASTKRLCRNRTALTSPLASSEAARLELAPFVPFLAILVFRKAPAAPVIVYTALLPSSLTLCGTQHVTQ